MQKNKRYYFGKFLNFIKNKFPKMYKLASGKGLQEIVYEALISYYIDANKNLVEEVKNINKSKEIVEPEVIRE